MVSVLALQLIVLFAGQMITGFSLSVTVTVNVADLVLPDASVAVAVTFVVPIANTLPLASE